MSAERRGASACAKPGDVVAKGEPILELHTDDAATLDAAPRRHSTARSRWATSPPAPPPLVLERIAG